MLIGRKEEIRQLNKAYNSKESEFAVVYGRRRVGKTYLIREVFEGRFTFQYTGAFDVSNQDQLQEFYKSLLVQGLPETAQPPKTWFEAFHHLEDLITASPQGRKVIFLDELAWMDATNSNFVPALEHFWNGWALARKDILLIICASATSWIINKVFRNKGGLYNRETYSLKILQFSLAECEELVKSLRLPMSRHMIIDGYMVMGGVPYYWSKLDREKSLSQNINDLFLKEGGLLRNEFNKLYATIFNRPEKYIKVVEALTGRKAGLTREEIVEKSKLDNNGQLSDILEDLEESGFIRKYWHINKKTRGGIYQLVDCYTLFYYKFVRKAHNIDEEYWSKLQTTQTYSNWCGLAFERVCLLHSRQLKSALGISGIMANIFSWHIKGDGENKKGAQIDLLIDRADKVINVCEMKYSSKEYSVKKSDINGLNNKVAALQQNLPKTRYISPVLVASNGISRNNLSEEFRQIVTGDQLFAP